MYSETCLTPLYTSQGLSDESQTTSHKIWILSPTIIVPVPGEVNEADIYAAEVDQSHATKR